jgi:hypothetical protein
VDEFTMRVLLRVDWHAAALIESARNVSRRASMGSGDLEADAQPAVIMSIVRALDIAASLLQGFLFHPLDVGVVTSCTATLAYAFPPPSNLKSRIRLLGCGCGVE